MLKVKKYILSSIIFVLFTVIAMCKTANFASAVTETLSNLPIGTKIMFGSQLFSVVDPTKGLVVSQKITHRQVFDSDNTQIFNPYDSEGDNIGNYLNTTYLNSFTSEQANLIKTATWYIGNETNETGSSVTAKIGLLRKSEYLSVKGSQAPAETGYIFPDGGEYSYCWTITPYSVNSTGVINVNYLGAVSNGNANITLGVRPALQIEESTSFKYDDISGIYYYEGTGTTSSGTVSGLTKGNSIMFGNTAFRVVDPAKGLVVMDYSIKSQAFDSVSTYSNVFNPSASDNIANYLNTTYLSTFTPDQKALIKNATWYIGNENNETLVTTMASIGLLRIGDYNAVNAGDIFPSTGENAYWWTLTQGSGDPSYVRIVREDGSVNNTNANIKLGVRPALQIIESTKVISVAGQAGVYRIATSTTHTLSQLGVGTKIMFGSQLFSVVDPTKGLVVSQKITHRQVFDSDNTQIFNPYDSEGDNIGNYLNTTYLNSFTSEQANLIKTATWYIGNETNETGSSVTAKIGLLRKSEYLSVKGSQAPAETGYIFPDGGEYSYWWTITPYFGYPTALCSVADKGNLISCNSNIKYGVRPALQIDESTSFTYDDISGIYYYKGTGTTSAGTVSGLTKGNSIMFGNTAFRVVDPAKGLIVMDYSIKSQAFDSSTTYSNVFNPSDVGNIANYLNTSYYSTLTTDQKALIKNATWYIGNEINETAVTTTAKIGLLRATEYNSVIANSLPSNSWDIFPNTGENSYWCTLTPDSSNSLDVYFVDPNGTLFKAKANNATGIRPALQIKESTRVLSVDGQAGVYIIDNIPLTLAPPTNITVTPIDGTIVANSLNFTNTHMKASATIREGEWVGGYAQLLIDGVVRLTDSTIIAGDTEVIFVTSDGTPTNDELQETISEGGVVSVKIFNNNGISATSLIGNPTLVVDYVLPVNNSPNTIYITKNCGLVKFKIGKSNLFTSSELVLNNSNISILPQTPSDFLVLPSIDVDGYLTFEIANGFVGSLQCDTKLLDKVDSTLVRETGIVFIDVTDFNQPVPLSNNLFNVKLNEIISALEIPSISQNDVLELISKYNKLLNEAPHELMFDSLSQIINTIKTFQNEWLKDPTVLFEIRNLASKIIEITSTVDINSSIFSGKTNMFVDKEKEDQIYNKLTNIGNMAMDINKLFADKKLFAKFETVLVLKIKEGWKEKYSSIEIPSNIIKYTFLKRTSNIMFKTSCGSICFKQNSLSNFGTKSLLFEIKDISNVVPEDSNLLKKYDINLYIDGSKVTSTQDNFSIHLPFSYNENDDYNLTVKRENTDSSLTNLGGMYNHSFKRMVFVSNHLSIYFILNNAYNFSDSDSPVWAKDYISGLAAKGIVSGDSNNMFLANNFIKREEFTAMGVSTFNFMDASAQSYFQDVDKSQWYYSPISSAVKIGIIRGYNSLIFGVGDPLTRQDIATVIANCLYKTNKLNYPNNPDDIISSYLDKNLITKYAISSVAMLKCANIMKGDAAGNFKPTNYITRAETATIVYLALKLYLSQGFANEIYQEFIDVS